jgi:hypothetical protein
VYCSFFTVSENLLDLLHPLSGNPDLSGKLCKVDLLVLLTSLDQIIPLHYINYLNEEVNCTEPSPSVRITWFYIYIIQFSC